MAEFDFNTAIELNNSRAQLKPLEAADIPYLEPIAFQDPTLLDYSPSEIHTQATLEEYVLTALDKKKKQLRYPFIIYDKQSERIAGSTSYGNISNRDKRVEIGWTWIGRAFQGTGLNTACKFLLLQYAFDILDFERVEFKIDGRNQRSRRAVEKIGGKFEGELRSHTTMPNGFRRNTVYYGILKTEWEENKKSIFKEFTKNL